MNYEWQQVLIREWVSDLLESDSYGGGVIIRRLEDCEDLDLPELVVNHTLLVERLISHHFANNVVLCAPLDLVRPLEGNYTISANRVDWCE